MLKAIAFDPGITTGWAIGEINETDGEMLVSMDQEKFSVSDVFSRLEELEPDFIIYERFDFRNKARSGLELFSRELIGVFELYVQRNSRCSIYKQSPGSVINGYFDRRKLVEAGVWTPGAEYIHSNEACMHLLYWYTFGAGFKYNRKGYRAA